MAALLVVAAACGSSKNNNNNNNNNNGGGGSTAVGENVATGAFKVQIQSVTMPAAAGGQPVVTFRVTGANDAPIDDLAQRIKNGPPTGSTTPAGFPWTSTPRFTLSALQGTGDYQSYYTTEATGLAAGYDIENPADPATPFHVSAALPTATQATFKAPSATAPDIQGQGNGVYTWTMPALPQGATVDPAATHTAGVWMTNHPAAGADTESATSTLNFVPNGGAPQKLETIVTDACNRCHAPALSAHDQRLGTQVCLTCHSPQTTDPDSGNSVNFKSMIHRIHYGADLPSAQQPAAAGSPPNAFRIIGFGGSVHTYRETFINDVRNCTLCHQGANADNWKNNASFTACTSCHDNVNLDPDKATAVGTGCQLGKFETAACNHPSLGAGTGAGVVNAQTDCRQCHTATAPAIGVQAVHVPLSEQAKAFRYDIMAVDVDPATRVPTITFAVRKLDNSAYDLQTAPEYTRTGASLTALFGWPTQEFTNEGATSIAAGQPATAPGQPARVAIVSGTPPALGSGVTPVAGQPGVYQVTGPAIPDAAKAPVTASKLGGAPTSAYVHFEGHPISASLEQMPVKNAYKTFPVGAGATVQDRRTVVDTAKCDACHGYVSAHGRNRNDETKVCVACHNPRATDVARRLSAAATTAVACRSGTPEQSIDFKVLIHEIHSGDIRGDDPVTICGFGNSPATFPGEVGIPHGVANCNLCHVNESWNVPAPTSPIPLDTTVSTGSTTNNNDQSDDVTIGRVRAVCTSCHSRTRFAKPTTGDLPPCNTIALNSAECLHSAGEQPTDANCSGCHAKGQIAGLEKVHPIQ